MVPCELYDAQGRFLWVNKLISLKMKYSFFENSRRLDSFPIPYYNNNSEHLQVLTCIFPPYSSLLS